MHHTYIIIMAGGVGTRFWPFSRTANPKQFHDVSGKGQSLLQQTAGRFEGICPLENIYVVTGLAYKEQVRQQLPFLSEQQILLEPSRCNTAPCIAYACYKIASQDPNATVVVTPADHIVEKEEVFREKIRLALQHTRSENILLTLGIQPVRPDTGYGYIQFVPDPQKDLKKVSSFREKPNLGLAVQFLESGEYVWNAGIFVWNVQAILYAFKKYLPGLDALFSKAEGIYYTRQEQAFIEAIYPLCENISIDNGIMEKADNVHVILSDIGWSDLGTWKSLYDISPQDPNGNVTAGSLMLYDTRDCIIKTPDDQLVVVQGLEGYIIAQHKGVLLICRKDEEQRIKAFVNDAQAFGEQYI